MSLPRPRVLSPRQPPREGPAVVDGSIVLAPALRKLSKAGDDAGALAEVVESLPAFLLMPLIEYGLRRYVVKDEAMRALIVAAGAKALVAHLSEQAKDVCARFMQIRD